MESQKLSGTVLVKNENCVLTNSDRRESSCLQVTVSVLLLVSAGHKETTQLKSFPGSRNLFN